MASSSDSVTLFVFGDIVAPCIKLPNLEHTFMLADVGDLIRGKLNNLPAFKFYKNENDSVELNPLEIVASLSNNNGAKVVYVRPVTTGCAYLYDLAIIFALSRLND